MKFILLASLATVNGLSNLDIGSDCSNTHDSCAQDLCCGNAILEGMDPKRVCNSKDEDTWFDEDN